MEDATFAALLHDVNSLLTDVVEKEMTTKSPWETTISTQSTATSESEDDPMNIDDRGLKKKGKPTYYARRDEIQTLQAELEVMTKRMEELQRAKQLEEFGQIDGAVVQNVLLRNGLKQTDFALASMQSIFANYRAMHGRNPLEVYIRLSADPTQRHDTLKALRAERLREATDFILERVRYLDMRRSHRESESFELPNGDHVVVQCEVDAALFNTDVKQVFDDVVTAILHQEFTIGEALGVTTTLESDGPEDRSYSQTRELTTLPGGAQVEENKAIFSSFSPGTPHLMVPHGLIVLHPIAEDERYPFQPHQRVRQDGTMVLLVCPLPGQDRGVSVIRWSHTHMYKPQCGISLLQEMRIRDMTARSSEIIRNNALEFVLGRAGHA